MTDYDARQLKMMVESLGRFERKEISLGRLVADLSGLLEALEGGDRQWKDAFQKQWGVLEDVNADLADRNSSEMTDEYTNLLDGAVSELRGLIAERQQ